MLHDIEHRDSWFDSTSPCGTWGKVRWGWLLGAFMWHNAWAQPLLDVEKGIGAATNAARLEVQVGPVVLDSVLSEAARRHSQEMLEKGYFGHTSPNEMCRTLRERLKGVNRFCLSTAENLYKCEGYPASKLVESSMESWLNSPVHQKNLLNKRFNRVGVGVARRRDEVVFTQVFSYEPVIIQDIQVILEPGGYRVRLDALVADGPRQGGLFVGGKRRADWQAGIDGIFTAEVLMPAGTLEIGQLVGPLEWSVETEIPIPPPNATVRKQGLFVPLLFADQGARTD